MGGLTAVWEGEFPRPGAEEDAREWAHHGIAVLPDGRVAVADARGSRLAICQPDGRIEHVMTLPIIQAHGITVEAGDDGTFLWVADNGDHRWLLPDGSVTPRSDAPQGRVLKVGLDGEVLLSIGVPRLPQYRDAPFSPTHVVVDEANAGSGDVWICDGYGASLVIRVTPEGEIAQVIDGVSGMGHFNQPHGATIDRRRGAPELLVADRANSRIQVFDLDGRFQRGVGVGDLRSPGHFAPYGRWLLVAELHRRIMALGEDDAVHTVLDCRTGAADEFEGGWPNVLADEETTSPAFQPGMLNSPHSIAVAGDRLYVAEWVIGGRLCTFTLQAS